MDNYPEEMSQERLAEIKARLAERPPFRAVAKGGQSPVGEYLTRLRNDQIELVREVERLRAERGSMRRPDHVEQTF